MTDVVEIIRATDDDSAFLRAMSYEAMYWDPDAPRPGLVAGLSEDHLSRYVEGWGRAGDDALVARDEVVRIGEVTPLLVERLRALAGPEIERAV